MAFINIPNVKMSGIASCVPKKIEKNIDSSLFLTIEDAEKFIKSTGIVEKRVVSEDITSSDLCYNAAEKLIAELNWNKEEIDCLVFITQTPDYIVPATACILQHRLGLSKDTICFDISLACSGYVYALTTAFSYLKNIEQYSSPSSLPGIMFFEMYLASVPSSFVTAVIASTDISSRVFSYSKKSLLIPISMLNTLPTSLLSAIHKN